MRLRLLNYPATFGFYFFLSKPLPRSEGFLAKTISGANIAPMGRFVLRAELLTRQENFDIAIITRNLSYKSFDVEFRNLKNGDVHFIFRKNKNEIFEIIEGVSSATFYKNNEGFSNRMSAASVYFIETVLMGQYYTRACVLLDVPWISQEDLLKNKSETVARLRV